MAYLGKTQLKASDIKLKAATTISGSSTNTVVLTWDAPNEQSLVFKVNGVTQNSTDFTIAGSPTTITLASGNFADGSVVEVVGINDIGTAIVPADGSVTRPKLATSGTPDGTKFLQDDMAWTTVDSLPSQTSQSGKFLTTDGSSASWAAAGGLFASYAFIVDQKTQGSDSGTFTSGAWRTRDLNTEITDPDGIVSIAANEFTLAAGSYLIKWSAPAHMVEENQTRLYDVTGAAAVQVGSSAFTYVNHPTYTYEGPSSGVARVTPSSPNVYRIEHYGKYTTANNGFGPYADIDVEIYTMVEIYKES